MGSVSNAHQVCRQFRAALARAVFDRAGVTTMLTAMTFSFLAGTAALAVDVGVWLSDKQALQVAADQAALSAVADVMGGGQGFVEAQAILARAGYACTNPGTVSQGTLSCRGTSGVTVTINNPPTTGAYKGLTSAWEVLLSRPETKLLSAVLFSAPPTVSARAVATSGGNVCFLSLDQRSGAIHSLFATTGANVSIDNCSVANNLLSSTGTDSIDVKEQATVNVAGIIMRTATVCDSGVCDGTLNSATAPVTVSQAIQDPYANRKIPSGGAACNHINLVVNQSTTLDPGVYCGTNGNAALTISPGISLINKTNPGGRGSNTLNFASTAGVTVGMTVADQTNPAAIPAQTTVTAVTATTVTLSAVVSGGNGGLQANDVLSFSTGRISVTLNPGVYILDGQGGGTCSGTTKPLSCASGDLDISGASVSGNGVTVVLTTSTGLGVNVGTLSVSGGSEFALTAPTSDVSGYPVTGMAIWQDIIAPKPSVLDPNKYQSNTTGLNRIDSGSTSDITGVVYFPSQGILFSGGSGTGSCTQVIALTITFVSNTNVKYPQSCFASSGVMSLGSSPKNVE